jgi:hypothetical protein
MHKNLKNRIGQIFGRLTVVAYAGKRPVGKQAANFWLCRCVCGSEVEVHGGNLVTGNTQSCGCLWHETPRNQKRPFENAFNSLLWQAKHRGIEVNLSYAEFLNFTKSPTCHYCGETVTWKPYGSQASQLDRIDNTLGYSVSNCVTACATCNRMKNVLGYRAFISQCKKVALQHREAAHGA